MSLIWAVPISESRSGSRVGSCLWHTRQHYSHILYWPVKLGGPGEDPGHPEGSMSFCLPGRRVGGSVHGEECMGLPAETATPVTQCWHFEN